MDSRILVSYLDRSLRMTEATASLTTVSRWLGSELLPLPLLFWREVDFSLEEEEEVEERDLPSLSLRWGERDFLESERSRECRDDREDLSLLGEELDLESLCSMLLLYIVDDRNVSM